MNYIKNNYKNKLLSSYLTEYYIPLWMTEVPWRSPTPPLAENEILCSLEHGINIADTTGYHHWLGTAMWFQVSFKLI
jgi:hypothetical protein